MDVYGGTSGAHEIDVLSIGSFPWRHAELATRFAVTTTGPRRTHWVPS